MITRIALALALLLGTGGMTILVAQGAQPGSEPSTARILRESRTPESGESSDPGDSAGAASCQPCHPDVFSSWESSHHGRTGRALATPPGGYDFAIGSSWMQAYLREDDSGLHRLAPECFDIRNREWRAVDDVLDAIQGPLMPEEGSTRPPRETEKRSFERDCSGCHVSGTRLREDPEHERIAGGWRDTSIDCEACHGPARAHVEAWKRMDDGEPLLDLARLDARTASAVCARCHGGSPVGSGFTPFDAEHWVASPLTGPGVFSNGAASGQVYQADAFLRSACHRLGELSCTDCHGWHADGLQHTEHVDALCTRCHTAQASREHTHHALDDEGGRCVNCHMPRLLEGLLSHQRDHRITSPLPSSAEAPDACTACHEDHDKAWAAEWAETWWGPPSESKRAAVRAIDLARRGDMDSARPLLEQALSHPDPFYRWAAAARLGDPEPIADDALVEGRLLALELAAARPDGLGFLRAGLRDPSPVLRAVAYTALLQRGPVKVETPVADLEVAARISRGMSGVRVALARAYLARERTAEAVDVLEETLVFRKKDQDAWLVLAAAYLLGSREEAAAAAVRRWEGTGDPLSHLKSLVANLARSGEGALGGAVLTVVTKHASDPRVRSWAEARGARSGTPSAAGER